MLARRISRREVVMRSHPLLEELAHAALAVALLLAVLTLAYHLITGNSPLPFALGGALGFGAGIGVLVLTSPARR
jgi:hypothetical protein